MAYNTFTPPREPSIGSGVTNKIRNNLNQFGDGYSQSIKDGINYHEQELKLEWNYLTQEDLDLIQSFFVAQAGDSFEYTLPGETAAKKWRCLEWQDNYTERCGHSLTATLVRTY